MAQPNNSYAPVFLRGTYVFKPGGTAAGNVYTDWATLYADLVKTGGIRYILIDDSAAVCTMPAGSYDLSGVIISGNFGSGTQALLVLADGCVWTKLPILLTNGIVISSDSTTPIWTSSNGSVNFLFMSFVATVSAGSTGVFFKLSNSSSLSFLLDSGGTVTNGSSPAIDLTGSGIAAFYGTALGVVNSNVLKDDGTGVVIVLWGVGSFSYNSNQPSYSGGIATTLEDSALYHDYNESVSGLTSENVKEALDELAAGTLSRQILVPTNAGSGTISNNKGLVLLNPAGVIAAYTLTMPAAPYDQQTVRIANTIAAITALTLSPNSGQSFSTGAAIGTLAANGFAEYMYRSSNTTWYRVG